jgi:Peptidase inhibitor family I36
MDGGDGKVTDGLSLGEPGSPGRVRPGLGVTATDLAILTAFCRPYLDCDGRFVVPAPNNEILRELANHGVYLEMDALRGHLRSLYAKFGVEEGLNPAQKRARLAELVHEHGVIAGWEPRQDDPGVPATASPSRPAASVTPGPGTPRAAGLRRFLYRHPWMVAAAVAALAAIALAGELRDSGGAAGAPTGSTDPRAPANDKTAFLQTLRCQPRKFCLAKTHNMSGGMYQTVVDNPERGDADLRDDTFARFGNEEQDKALGPVSDNTWSAWNRSGHDVIVYEHPRSAGAAACVRNGGKINITARWKDRISSFEVVPRSVCSRHEVLIDGAR